MSIHTIRHPAIARSRAEAASKDLTWLIKAILRPSTVIGAFDSPYEASAAAAKAMSAEGVTRVWCRSGAEVGAVLREEWHRRPLLSKLLSVSDEDRVVEQVAGDIEKGRSVVVVHSRDTSRALRFLDAARHVIRLDFWTFDFS